MTIYLRQSTASQEVLLGALLDDDDGVTPKTGLTIANTDITIWKTGGTTIGTKNSGGATEISGGYYYAVFDATDTDTAGTLIIAVKMDDCIYHRLEAVVLPANVYDSMFSTDLLQVDLTQIAGAAVDAAAAQVGVNVVNWKGSAAAAMTGDAYARLGAPAGASVSADVAAMKVDTAAILVDTAVIGALGAGLTAIPWNAAWDAEVQSEVADALAVYDPPTNAEMEARTLVAASYFDPAADVVAHVTLCDTCTTNTDMRGTNSAALASVCTEGRLAELDAANLPTDIADVPTTAEIKTAIEAAGGHLALILEDTGTTIPATLATVLLRIHPNSKITSPVFSVTGKMTSCTVTRYPTKADADAGTNGVAYAVTATYDGDDNLATYAEVATS